jgi:tripartite-type tricarboxylate transporter receptor subunit TctC
VSSAAAFQPRNILRAFFWVHNTDSLLSSIKLKIPITIFVFFLLAGTAIPALAAQRSASIDERAVADFYRGKVVRIVVGFPPGGGADVYSRILARHLGRFIPGRPTVAVTNMPGAGSIIAGNHIFNAGAKDGTEIGMLNGAVILEQLFDNPGIQFDMARFRYLAVPVTETYVMIVTRASGITGFRELIGANAKQAVLGAIPNSTLEHAPILLREALDANLRVVSGYKGSAEIRLAIDSDEIGGFFNPWSTVKASSLEKFTSGQWSVILQLGDQPLADLPSSNVPTIADLTRDESQRMLLRYGTVAPNQFGKVYMLRAGVPADRAAALEAAFASTFADRSFLADAEKSQLEITPLYAESIRQIVGDFLTMPAAIKERLRRSIKR